MNRLIGRLRAGAPLLTAAQQPLRAFRALTARALRQGLEDAPRPQG